MHATHDQTEGSVLRHLLQTKGGLLCWNSATVVLLNDASTAVNHSVQNVRLVSPWQPQQ